MKISTPFGDIDVIIAQGTPAPFALTVRVERGFQVGAGADVHWISDEEIRRELDRRVSAALKGPQP